MATTLGKETKQHMLYVLNIKHADHVLYSTWLMLLLKYLPCNTLWLLCSLLLFLCTDQVGQRSKMAWHYPMVPGLTCCFDTGTYRIRENNSDTEAPSAFCLPPLSHCTVYCYCLYRVKEWATGTSLCSVHGWSLLWGNELLITWVGGQRRSSTLHHPPQSEGDPVRRGPVL